MLKIGSFREGFGFLCVFCGCVVVFGVVVFCFFLQDNLGWGKACYGSNQLDFKGSKDLVKLPVFVQV